jgi:hypothetical protein
LDLDRRGIYNVSKPSSLCLDQLHVSPMGAMFWPVLFWAGREEQRPHHGGQDNLSRRSGKT